MIIFTPVPSDAIYGLGDQSDFGKVRDYELVSTPSSEYGLQNAQVQQIIHSTNMSFDLVINEDFYHESWLMFGYKFKVPTVTICMYLIHYTIFLFNEILIEAF